MLEDEGDYDIIESPKGIKKPENSVIDTIDDQIDHNEKVTNIDSNKTVFFPEENRNHQEDSSTQQEIKDQTLISEDTVMLQNKVTNKHEGVFTENISSEDDVKEPEIQDQIEGNIDAYFQNRSIILLNSFLLGISYSIIRPTLWTYIGEFGKGNFTRIIYCMTYIAYPLASVISALIVDLTKFNGKRMVLILNLLQVMGNLVYMLNYIAFLPWIGRIVAGLGDAFYVILLEQTKVNSSLISNKKMTIECLAAFVFGIIISPGINILTTFMKVETRNFQLNENNFPGLTMASLFLIVLLINSLFLKDFNRNVKDCKNTFSKFPPFSSQNNKYTVEYNFLKQVMVVGIYSLYSFIVIFVELMIPILIYERLKLNAMGAILVYAVISLLYGLFLFITVKVSLKCYLEVLVAISSAAEIVNVIVIYILHRSNAENIVYLFISVVISLPLLWANADVMFVSLLQRHIAEDVRDSAYYSGKRISNFAIVGATLTVIFYSQRTSAAISLILLIFILLSVFVEIIVDCYTRKKISDEEKFMPFT